MGIDEKKQGGDEGQYEVRFSSIVSFYNVILSSVMYCDVQQLELMFSVNTASLTPSAHCNKDDGDDYIILVNSQLRLLHF